MHYRTIFIRKDFIKNCNEDSNKGNIFYVDIEYPKNLHDLHSLLEVDLSMI